ncbi:RNA-binding domain-containing protein [Cohnella sp.]|uniref:RNA-binding domain-containing protein n=1 Tax=Cohnella sp. TaxID=1883426 RepID=UPI003562831F
MVFVENAICELKREFTPELKKEAIAFVNTDGGEIYIGIADDGTVVGVEQAESVLTRIMNMLRDSIKPDISMFTSPSITTINGLQVIVLLIQRGTSRPYYIAEKGLKPSGVYVRQGLSSVPASESAIRQMIIETDGEKYEDIRSLTQDLTFSETSKAFKQQEMVFGESQMKTLNIINADQVFTNLGLLLSDQCPHSIKVAVFDGPDKNIFKDRREFSGSLLLQLTEVFMYIDLHNKTNAQFKGINRIDKRDYPEAAIREALLNSIVHRDYAFSGSTLVNIYSNRIEFISLGGLVRGITINDIMLGISQPRNEKLASLFYRLKFVEAYGTGISKIMASYQEYDFKPVLQTSDNAFVISLPNRNEYTASKATHLPITMSAEEIIVDYLESHPSISRKTVEQLLNTSQTAAGKIVNEMVRKNILHVVGSGRSTRYILVK